ncbi:hypothetical protein K493DRAFT_357269 [Basidiobolus meristosporus CBS 931.73]|uniref:Transmembrane protein n=1 Tax=Basidiobolus meristosporus CBS 931.73 TaxID=1314790 RepID=A0A1Y1XWJ3_9FUNG|nr:hypothetical protein K493DRAFT_357269 [Basidiobolus meristosporus CBS 931.73]|eukprot:ORX90093.1 hypothetical protein K493DRAFT_357269 [Basidiobolus meristosporus CBS 931.73]
MDASTNLSPALVDTILSEKTSICILSMANCQIVAFVTNYAHEFSLDCIMIILLIKATVSNQHHVVIYAVGGVCLAASIALHSWHAITAVYTRSVFGACGNVPDPLIAILWFSCLWTLNAFLSGCFLTVIYKHHRRKKSPVYKSFLKDGMWFFLLITVSNIITPSLVIRGVLGENSSILFDVDWAIQCVLITLQLSHSSKFRQGQSNFSHSLSVPPELEGPPAGLFPKTVTATTLGKPKNDKAEPWEDYLIEIPLEEVAQYKATIIQEQIDSGQKRSTSEEPLTHPSQTYRTHGEPHRLSFLL